MALSFQKGSLCLDPSSALCVFCCLLFPSGHLHIAFLLCCLLLDYLINVHDLHRDSSQIYTLTQPPSSGAEGHATCSNRTCPLSSGPAAPGFPVSPMGPPSFHPGLGSSFSPSILITNHSLIKPSYPKSISIYKKFFLSFSLEPWSGSHSRYHHPIPISRRL